MQVSPGLGVFPSGRLPLLIARLAHVISRCFVRCPGCDETITVRVGAQPTDLTKFYFPCPSCRLPIHGRISGRELETHTIDFEADKVSESELSPTSLVVTVNPFVPARYGADSADFGAFPTITLHQLLGDEQFPLFQNDHVQAEFSAIEVWPPVRMLFTYYRQGRWDLFEKTAKSKLDWDAAGKSAHERAALAYQALLMLTTQIVATSGQRGEKLLGRYNRKHLASVSEESYAAMAKTRTPMLDSLERDMFVVLGDFVKRYEMWTMGRLPRFVSEQGAQKLEDLVLFRDEFTEVRDLYQQGFEVASKCLWLLVAAQNSVKNSDPNTFSDHPDSVPVKKRVSTLAQFDQLSNAYKIAYAAQVPGWDCLLDLLDNKRRNSIGHASARHDLDTGRIVSDKDPNGITYITFLGETFGVFEVLGSLMQVVRAMRLFTSPDFQFNRP